MWFNQDWSLARCHRMLLNEFFYTLIGDLPDEPIPTYDQVFGLSNPREQMRYGFDNPNETSLPFIVNVFNPDNDSHSGEDAICPFQVRHDLRLREYLALVCDNTIF